MKKIGIIVSSPFEAEAFGKKPSCKPTEISPGVFINSCGPGQKGVHDAILHLTYEDVDGLISWGFAGGLDPSLETGTLVIPHQVIHPFGQTLSCDETWHQFLKESIQGQMSFSEKPIVHSEAVLKTPAQKQLVALRTHGAAVDQESFWIAYWANQLKIPMIAIRVILDDAQTQLPENIEQIQLDNGHVNPKALFKALMTPSFWPHFMKLKSQYQVCQNTLKTLSTGSTGFTSLYMQ